MDDRCPSSCCRHRGAKRGNGTWQDVRFSGRANEQNVIKYDGIEGSAIIDASPGNVNGETNTPFKLQASLENVQEFRVESSSYPAEFGTGTGGQVSVITKSGGKSHVQSERPVRGSGQGPNRRRMDGRRDRQRAQRAAGSRARRPKRYRLRGRGGSRLEQRRGRSHCAHQHPGRRRITQHAQTGSRPCRGSVHSERRTPVPEPGGVRHPEARRLRAPLAQFDSRSQCHRSTW